jgi:hypothetical protein
MSPNAPFIRPVAAMNSSSTLMDFGSPSSSLIDVAFLPSVLEPFKTLVLLLTLQSIRTCHIQDSKNTKQCCSTTPEII